MTHIAAICGVMKVDAHSLSRIRHFTHKRPTGLG